MQAVSNCSTSSSRRSFGQFDTSRAVAGDLTIGRGNPDLEAHA
jgi:hypothetical protein